MYKPAPVRQRIKIIKWAIKHCDRWYTEILDCSKSFSRKDINLTIKEILEKLGNKFHFVISHRDLLPENYIEICCRSMGHGVDYFLWIRLDPKYKKELEEKWTGNIN